VLRDAVAIAARKAEVARAEHLALTIPGEGAGRLTPADRVTGLVEGILLGSYKFDRYLSEDSKKAHPAEEITIVTDLAPGSVKEGIKVGSATSEATILARDLVTEHAGVMHQTELYMLASASARK